MIDDNSTRGQQEQQKHSFQFPDLQHAWLLSNSRTGQNKPILSITVRFKPNNETIKSIQAANDVFNLKSIQMAFKQKQKNKKI